MDAIKAHGTGNDFVVLVDLDDRLDLEVEFVRALCDRRTGIGADGVIRIGAARGDADVFMDYRNADGSIVEMCGNGVRVVAKVVADRRLVPVAETLRIDTRAGVKPVVLHRDGGTVAGVTVDMGAPELRAEAIPVDLPDARGFQLDVAPEVTWTAVSMGNPHAITLVDAVVDAPVHTLGPRVERHDRFPRGTNVEFASVVDTTTVDLRVWERGVGETRACGTGACATVVALRETGLVGDEVVVRLPGGELTVTYRPHRHPSVFLTGPAEIVADLAFADEWVRARVPSDTAAPAAP